jgi:site-specific DNA recombinase
MTRQVVTYIRVSTEEQAKHGYSIEAQRQILQDYAKGHGLDIVHEFEESESAFKPGRPEFKKMLSLLRKRRSITAVLCYKIDRIARNLQDYSALDEMEGVSIISATEALPENSTGKLIGTVQAAFSRYYSEQLSERIRLGLETKARKGEWPTHPPTGYIRVPETGQMIPDPMTSSLVCRVFEEYVRQSISLLDLAKWARSSGLRSHGGGTLNKSAIHKLIQNPIYYGSLVWKGKLYEGVHEPIVSRQLFDRVQERLRSGSSARATRSFPYRGLLQCGFCGCMITASIAKRKYVYYHCSHGRGHCDQPYFRQDRLSEALVKIVEGVHLPREKVRSLLKMLQSDTSRQMEKRNTEIAVLKRGEDRIHIRREASYVDKLDGKISEHRWLELDRTWAHEMAAIKARREGLADISEGSADEIRATFELLERAPDLYLRQDDAGRARLLGTLVSNCLIKGDNLEPVYKNPFSVVAKGVQSGEWWRRADSNRQPLRCERSALPIRATPPKRKKSLAAQGLEPRTSRI